MSYPPALGTPPHSFFRNVLLRSLPEQSLAELTSHLEVVDLPTRTKLGQPGRECSSVYFLESGVASVVGRVGDEWQEVGLFGQEGAGCLSVVLGATKVPYLIMMQVAGTGYRIPAATITKAFQSDPAVRDVLLRYIQAFLIQVSQSAIANSQYNTVQRMARWLLMIHDRVEGDSICLTHEYIAATLGVGRTGVTLALHELENSGSISTARKRVNILDRRKLEHMTASVYGFAESEYRRLVGCLELPNSNLSALAGQL